MRIGGLASGMDTDQIIRDLMRAERMPMDKLTQERQQLQWKMDSYREVNTLMTTFRDNIFDTVMRSTNMTAKTVTSSNPSFVTATAAANAPNGSYTVSKVSRLASAATNVSSSSISKGDKIDPAKDLYSQKELFKGNPELADSFNWKKGTVETENFTLTSSESTITLDKNNFVNEADLKEAMSVKVNGKAYNLVLDPNETLKDGEVFLNTETGELDFGVELNSRTKIDVTYVTESDENYFTSSISTFDDQGEMHTETFVFSGDKSLNQVIRDINSSSIGVSMFYDEFSDRVTVQRTETGNFNANKGTEAEIQEAEDALEAAIAEANSANVAWEDAQNEVKEAQEAYDQAFMLEYEAALISEHQEIYDDTYEAAYNEAIDAGEDEETAQKIAEENALQAVKDAATEETIEIATNAATAALEDSDEEKALEQAESDLKLAIDAKIEADELVVQKTEELAAISGKEIIFQGSFFANVLQLDTTNEQGGENAKFTINGLETERHSNTFTINGVTITLNDTFDAPPTNLTINTDTDKVLDTIVGFVNEYNEMLEKINGKLKEELYRDFKPLTDEQKEAMSERDIERWEEKAMSGMLRRDRTLSSGLDRLRMDIYNPVSGLSDNPNVRQLTDLGITTSRDYTDRGKLEIDEDKLRAAIENDPEGVFNLFTADGSTNAEKGIARRMRESLQQTMRTVSERAGGSFGKVQNHQFTIGRNMNDIDSRISNFERRLQQVEDRYWRQFTAMEKAMHQANSQAEAMFSQLFGNQ